MLKISIRRPVLRPCVVAIYPAVRRIASLLTIDFSFPTPGCRQRASSLPELTLISLLVIAVKLYYPFHSLPYHARSMTDPAVLTVDWVQWIEAHKAHEARLTSGESITRGSEIKVTEYDVMRMSGKQLDQYMDWYERTWVEDSCAGEKDQGLRRDLLNMFPTERLHGFEHVAYSYEDTLEKERQSTEQMSAEVVGTLNMRDIVSAQGEENSEEEGKRPLGRFYKRYRRSEDLPENGRAFYEAAAKEVGVKLETLVLTVLQLERKLINWREAQLKAERMDVNQSSSFESTSGSADLEQIQV